MAHIIVTFEVEKENIIESLDDFIKTMGENSNIKAIEVKI